MHVIAFNGCNFIIIKHQLKQNPKTIQLTLDFIFEIILTSSKISVFLKNYHFQIIIYLYYTLSLIDNVLDNIHIIYLKVYYF